MKPPKQLRDKVLSAEDNELVKQLVGVEHVKGIEFLSADLVGTGSDPSTCTIAITLNSVRQKMVMTVAMNYLYAQARSAADPWDGQPAREALFIHKLRERFPQFEIRDLSPYSGCHAGDKKSEGN
ncbi:MAG: hypothetical protein U5K54_00065 [Cytophagales bacterium]|nr:hypothetical protein [Cytophagales bacterium]